MVLLLLLFCLPAFAEVRTLTLAQTLQLALQQNPDLALARIDEQNAQQQAVRIARDPFTPRIGVGSGLAYSSGFPMSIEGSAPSIVQAQASQYLFNRPQSYAVAQARENARGAALGVSSKRDEVAFRVASLYLDAERAARIATLAQKETESLAQVLDSVRAAVGEGRELPLAAKRAEYNLARARQAILALDSDQAAAETSLALALGFSADDRIRPAAGERALPEIPESDDAAIRIAVETNYDLKRLQSQLAARGLEIRGHKAKRLPRVDLVAQYGLFARFNHYEDYYRAFQRNNGQLGVSFQLPLLPGPGIGALVAQSEGEVAKLRIEFTNTRNRISTDLRQAYRDVHKAESGQEVARLDLEVAREQVSVLLAQLHEGRVTLRQVEEARVAESDRWIALHDAQYALERARWAVLRLTGNVVAALGPAKP